MLLILICGVIALLILYYKIKYFTLRGPVPGLSPQFFFGNVIQSGMLLQGKSLAEIFTTFKQRYGDIFQFWFGATRYIVVGNISDVQHIFTHRNIYDQGDFFAEQFSTLFPNALVTLKG